MTEQMFKVGDRVDHRTFGRGEIAFGPVNFPHARGSYLHKDPAGLHHVVGSEGMTLAPAFVVGDEVEYTIGRPTRGKLVAGPFKSEHHDEPLWVMEKANGTHTVPTENALRVVEREREPEPEPIKAGDQVRILVDDANGVVVRAGDVFTVKTVDSTEITTTTGDGLSGRWYFSLENVEKVADAAAATYLHKGVTYECGVKYLDSDGDGWVFNVSPASRQGEPKSADESWVPGLKLSHVVASYGPLEKADA